MEIQHLLYVVVSSGVEIKIWPKNGFRNFENLYTTKYYLEKDQKGNLTPSSGILEDKTYPYTANFNATAGIEITFKMEREEGTSEMQKIDFSSLLCIVELERFS